MVQVPSSAPPPDKSILDGWRKQAMTTGMRKNVRASDVLNGRVVKLSLHTVRWRYANQREMISVTKSAEMFCDILGTFRSCSGRHLCARSGGSTILEINKRGQSCGSTVPLVLLY